MGDIYTDNHVSPFDRETLRNIMTHHRKDCVDKHEDCFEVQLEDAIKWIHSTIASSYCKKCHPGKPGKRSGICMGCGWPINEDY